MSNFNASVYFGTPVWSNEVPEFIQPINKLGDKYIKQAKKNLLPTLKERDKLYKRIYTVLWQSKLRIFRLARF